MEAGELLDIRVVTTSSFQIKGISALPMKGLNLINTAQDLVHTYQLV
jgi:hypothetical protein